MGSRRFLIINANWLGDVLFSTPALRALKKKHPKAQISCLVPARVAGLLRKNPHVHEVIVYNDRISFFSFPEFFRVAATLRRRRFDTAIFFHPSKTKAAMVRLAGIPERIGYEGRGRGLTQTVELPEKPVHKIELFLGLLEKAGIPSDGRQMEFFPDPAAQKELRELLSKKGVAPSERYSVVHAGGNWELKRWPARHFVKAVGFFLKEFPGRVILCGGASERGLAEAILSGVGDDRALSLCGETSLDALGLLLKNAEFLLSNDSGPIHLAASQGTKVVGLFGPTVPELTGPSATAPMRILRKDVGCDVPCYYRSCDHRVCMDWLTPEEVLAQTKEIVHA